MLSDGGSPHPRCRGTPRVGGLPSFAQTFRFPRLDAVQSIQVVPRVSLVPASELLVWSCYRLTSVVFL